VLHAQVNKDGMVQALKVISGPDILITAAWHSARRLRIFATW